MSNILVVVGIIGVISLIGYMNYRNIQKRKKKIIELAQKLKAEYIYKDASILNLIKEFNIYNTFGRNYSAENIIKLENGNDRHYIFDFKYTIGNGKGTHHITQVTNLIESKNFSLPDFHLSFERILDKVANWFGYTDIDFKEFPEFSKKYKLKGKDELKVRSLFTAELIQEIMEMGKLNEIAVEGLDNKLLIYTPNSMFESYQKIITDSIQITKVLKNSKNSGIYKK